VIEVLKPGLLTTVQDAGRFGWRAFGMPTAGAMDRHACAIANLLAGNEPGAAALEMTLVGASFRFHAPAYVALAGADLAPVLDGAPVATWSAFRVEAGDVLTCSPAKAGVRAYLAVHGGIDVPPVLGSRSTYLRAGVGGFAGRALRGGDRLPVGPATTALPTATRRLTPSQVPTYPSEVTLRVMLGPQDDRFTARGVAALLEGEYTVTAKNDRMGYRLEGPRIEHAAGADIVSDALCPGAVQVPGEGQPIVMAVDAQTAGGYAKIAAVIGPDLSRLAQARQGDRVRFARVSEREAVAALQAERDGYAGLRAVVGG
jgi:antagonist of KipI